MYINTVPKLYRMLKYPKMMIHFCGINFAKFALDKMTGTSLFLNKAKNCKRAVGRSFINNDGFNEILKQKIRSGEPFFCCRYGNSELTACFYALMREKGILDHITAELLKKAKTGPGVFPEKEDTYLSFAKIYAEALKNADLNAYWGTVLMEEYLVDQIMGKGCVQYAMRALEPFQYSEPWTLALGGGTVLVVHPFAELIESQYQRRKEIFPNKEIMPKCNLKVVKAIQSSGETVPEEYKDWSEALDALYSRCMEEQFDVALLACGSYAVPLASRLKNAGKQSIVLGGMMQLMFGIKGARWEASRPDIVEMYNDAWVRAGVKEQVKDADKMVDGAAYW